MKRISFILFFLMSLSLSAQTFQKFGSVEEVKYRPINSPLAFQYDVIYYIPAKLKGKQNLKSLVFLHGGGRSTSDRAGSMRVTRMYFDNLKKLADDLGVVMVAPSGSGLNWGAHMFAYLEDLTETLKKDLAIDPNGIGLTGHSMGGMGITRSYQWLADEFAFFMPVAAGMDPKYFKKEYLSTMFNTTYYHLQGLKDHFQVFVERVKLQHIEMMALEKEYKTKSGWTREFYNGAHNYPYNLYKDRLETLLKTKKRDLFQKKLRGVIYYRNETLTTQWSNGIEFYLAPRERYFWVEGKEFSMEKKVVSFVAEAKDNVINIKIDEGVKTLRVYLSSKMLNLKESITIKVNGKEFFDNMADMTVDMSQARAQDPGFTFESYVDIELPNKI
jgi:hypothetical protein